MTGWRLSASVAFSFDKKAVTAFTGAPISIVHWLLPPANSLPT